MKSFQVAYILAGVLLVIAFFLIIPASPVSDAKTATIPPGTAYYYYISLSVFKADHISGTFAEANNQTVFFYVFDQGQYDAFKTQPGVPASLFSTSGTSGSFSASFSLPGTYYLVTKHGGGTLEATTQVVNLSFTLSGFSLVPLGIGLALAAAAVGVWLVGSRKKKSLLKSQPPAPSDVTLFNQPSPPPQ